MKDENTIENTENYSRDADQTRYIYFAGGIASVIPLLIK